MLQRSQEAEPKARRFPAWKGNPKREGGYFDDLPYALRERARHYFDGMIRKRRLLGQRLSGWVRPILMGQARRLAKNPPTSAWGRSMQAKKGEASCP